MKNNLTVKFILCSLLSASSLLNGMERKSKALSKLKGPDLIVKVMGELHDVITDNPDILIDALRTKTYCEIHKYFVGFIFSVDTLGEQTLIAALRAWAQNTHLPNEKEYYEIQQILKRKLQQVTPKKPVDVREYLDTLHESDDYNE